jgi:hypothetical protein
MEIEYGLNFELATRMVVIHIFPTSQNDENAGLKQTIQG